MSALAITSHKTIRAGFPPIPFITSNDNPPNTNFLLLCTEHLGECAQSHLHMIHTFGHRNLTLTDVMWALESADAYPVRKTNPYANVTHGANDNAVTRANDGVFGVKYKDFGDEEPRTMAQTIGYMKY